MASPTGPSAPGTGGGGRTILGLKPRTALIAGVGIVGAALVFFWWRSRSSSSSTAASASASASAGSGATDYGGELSTIQSELEDLLAAEGQGGGGGSGSGGGTTTTTPPPAKAAPPTAPKPGGSAPPVKTTAKPKPAMPSGVHETKVTATSVTIAWAKDPNATSYRVRVTYQDKLVGTPHLVTGTSATVSGLSPLRTYTFHVAAIGPGGTSAETNGPAVKTK
jgi:hypothetical protein